MTFVPVKRIIYFMLMVVIMVLHLVPCADAHGITEGKVTIGKSTPGHQKTDACSPFCTCSCCVIYTVVKEPVKISYVPAFCPAVYNEYLVGTCIDIYHSILQPPQLLS